MGEIVRQCNDRPLDTMIEWVCLKKENNWEVEMAPARILVEPNAYHHLNIGDSAMLQVALERLRSLWPDASLEVLTDSPDRLRALCPSAIPVPAQGRRMWFGDPMATALRRLGKKPTSSWLLGFERLARALWNRSVATGLRARYLVGGNSNRSTDLDRFVEAVQNAELLVVTGAGAINDEYPGHASTILDLVQSFIQRDLPAVMMGQGIGPLTNSVLMRRSRNVLPGVNLIGLRERRVGPTILKELGVSTDRYVVTGDDALEFAYRLPSEVKLSMLGVNLRRARYSAVDDDILRAVRAAITEFVGRRMIKTIPLPISFVSHECDSRSIQAVLERNEREDTTKWHTQEEVVRMAGRCRTVLTGSYHAAVFALAQGTPVVAIAASPYYLQKFFGLADLFSVGCHVVVTSGPNLSRRLLEALNSAWESHREIGTALRDTAYDQIQRSRVAYERLREIVAS